MTTSKAQRARIAERRAKAIQLRLAGADWQTIADRLDYSSRGAACQDVTRALEANMAEQRTSIAVYRETELMRLDQLTVEVVRVLRNRHYVVTQSGRVVNDPNTGNPLTDDSPALQAVDRLLKIQDRRAKLLGLDKGVNESTTEATSMLNALADGIRAYASQAADPEQDTGGEG